MRITHFLDRSDRRGLLAVELRRSRPQPNEVYIIPWHEVMHYYLNGYNGLSFDRIREYERLKKEASHYNVGDFI